MNALLSATSKEILEQDNEQLFPIYFIIAQPRGVSTLFQQIITSNLDVGYISNFFAKFYDAVPFGLELEKEVMNREYKSNFISNYGNTEGIHEPHEWGWFWQKQLNLNGDEHYTKKDTFEELYQALSFISNQKQMPLLIDNVYAMANILKFKSTFKNIKIINLTRDLYFICNSIINARLSRFNNINEFYGHKPRNIEEILKIKNPIEQIVYQVKSIQNEIDKIVQSHESTSVLHIDYEEIFRDSFAVVNKFRTFVQKNDDITLQYKEQHLPKLSYRNDKNLIKPQYKEELDHFYEKYFGKNHD